MTYCYLNDNTDSNAGEGGLACEVSERRKDTFMAIPVIFFFFFGREIFGCETFALLTQLILVIWD